LEKFENIISELNELNKKTTFEESNSHSRQDNHFQSQTSPRSDITKEMNVLPLPEDEEEQIVLT